jgi:hypothetical protein
MPDRIQTAQIVGVDPETLEVSDAFPGTYGFYVRLSRDPGTEWAAEFESLYLLSSRPSRPPVIFRGDTLCVHYLPRYVQDLPEYLDFLTEIVTQTNVAVERRNAVLPDDSAQREAFREQLRQLAQSYHQTR